LRNTDQEQFFLFHPGGNEWWLNNLRSFAINLKFEKVGNPFLGQDRLEEHSHHVVSNFASSFFSQVSSLP
jgi:hypothetical protein